MNICALPARCFAMLFFGAISKLSKLELFHTVQLLYKNMNIRPSIHLFGTTN